MKYRNQLYLLRIAVALLGLLMAVPGQAVVFAKENTPIMREVFAGAGVAFWILYYLYFWRYLSKIAVMADATSDKLRARVKREILRKARAVAEAEEQERDMQLRIAAADYSASHFAASHFPEHRHAVRSL